MIREAVRRLQQPGPAQAERIEAVATAGREMAFDLAPGRTLIEALTGPVFSAGFRGGAATYQGAVLSPFRYVMPGPSQDPDHVAWFSAPRAAPGSRIEVANATLGWRDGAPFVHCHAVWIEPDGSRRGGHILPDETIVAAGTPVQAWGIEAGIAAEPDAETNFTLFHPVPEGEAGLFVAARVRPNQDIGAALSELCGRYGFGRAAVLGSVGSLIAPVFADGRTVEDYATEVLIQEADITQGSASIAMAVVDMAGQVHEGRLEPGANPVCITFEVLLKPV